MCDFCPARLSLAPVDNTMIGMVVRAIDWQRIARNIPGWLDRLDKDSYYAQYTRYQRVHIARNYAVMDEISIQLRFRGIDPHRYADNGGIVFRKIVDLPYFNTLIDEKGKPDGKENKD